VQKKRFIRRRVAFDNPETKIISFCEPAQAREFEGQSSIMGRAAVAGAALSSWLAVASAQSANTLAGMEAYNRGDFTAAYRLLEQEAKSGDPEAQVNLGYLFARGQGVFANQGEALRLYSLSAARGDGEGMNAVGYKYQYGTGVNKDIDVAVHWYCKAVEAGNARGMNNLAILLSDGLGVPKDEEQARDLWRQSAALGHTTRWPISPFPISKARARSGIRSRGWPGWSALPKEASRTPKFTYVQAATPGRCRRRSARRRKCCLLRGALPDMPGSAKFS
jgi:TPR repeat protein